ncbi:hypothetical protein [Candidatus Macondimonas diazotrophica]|jgi:crossover junction endodeoxyribonuclease RuvC|uniref:Uncharacterized protein n=1 Tax=Candidatus Macondimonas diazotrophica TaxID=2305248 RepID=A0A4Z0F6P4_9GAMM|nr:hypothetical protein [Candidatus Macondimonas diazotrophica]NCU02213.1 hypothetical protein [Candidatus Macondimonas diazotrophica]TFZ81293.1 hypothetical protein E4680_13075 [Candidatus Macondimonas diazotrophica]
MARSIFAIDPGKSGAISLLQTSYDGTQLLSVWDMPIDSHTGDPAAYALHAILRNADPSDTVCYIEQVGARPDQGVVSTFNFGLGYGICLGAAAIAGLPIVLVKPNVWKPKMRIAPGGTKTQKKARAMARATLLMPGCDVFWPLKKHDGRAESALIAAYGALKEGVPCTQLKPWRLNGDAV